MTDKYAVIGNPIAHSKSPLIHEMFRKQTGQDISYEAILSPLDGFAATVERLRKEGYKGCNVTVPFKFEAFKIADSIGFEVMDAATADNEADAVNTLLFKNNKIGGYNTDGTGLVNDIEKNLKIPLKDKRILLIGAGGAAAGRAGALAALRARCTGAVPGRGCVRLPCAGPAARRPRRQRG